MNQLTDAFLTANSTLKIILMVNANAQRVTKDLTMEHVSINVCLWSLGQQEGTAHAFLDLLKMQDSVNLLTVLLEHLGILQEKIAFHHAKYTKYL